MAQELELSDRTTIHEFQEMETNSGNTNPSERRLLRCGILTLAVLCVVQATLNISLRSALFSKEDTDQLPFKSSVIEKLCQIDCTQQNPTQVCSSCNLLKGLVREYEHLKSERDTLKDMVIHLIGDERTEDEFTGSGSGALEEFFDLKRN